MIGLGLSLFTEAVLGGGEETTEPFEGVLTSGLISEWRFGEGGGNSVNDEIGSNDINLTTPTNPNVTWAQCGVSLVSGLVQTPSIAGARTIVLMYRSNITNGFSISGGSSSASGQNAGSVNPVDVWHIGQGNGVIPSFHDADGTDAWLMTSGGWRVMFRELDQAYTSIFGFGGQHSSIANRCTSFELAWAGVYDDQLTAHERGLIYRELRKLAVERGFYIDRRDCPTKATGVYLWGQSNAEGRGNISLVEAADPGLTPAEQAYIYQRTYIAASDTVGAPDNSMALLQLGVNQQADGSSILGQCGAEFKLGADWEASKAGRLYISKTTHGGVYLAGSADGPGNPAASNVTWSEDEERAGGLFYKALGGWHQQNADLLNNGIGVEMVGLAWMQGESDGNDDAYAAAYAANLQSFYDTARLLVGYPSLKIAVGRIRLTNGGSASQIELRARQAEFVLNNALTCAPLIDTDSFPLRNDGLHYNADGVRMLGQAFYQALLGTAQIASVLIESAASATFDLRSAGAPFQVVLRSGDTVVTRAGDNVGADGHA